MEIFKNPSWLYSSSSSILITVLSTVGIYLAVLIITRLNGLRTFAKMSSFDFAITIAIGSVIASTLISQQNSLVKGIVALTVLVVLQAAVAKLRKKSNVFENAVTNTPVLLMSGSEILWHNLKANRVTEADLYAKLREANVYDMRQVLAVVLETTGDISVLHSEDQDMQLDNDLLKNVRR
ncbi:membrane protein [Roseivirga seohaensis subsp. aquiponti]|uniref:Membrane protein n=1 Tax=Roseivirga seohaensis subsp. aquiponti TaxID=1566026 RepID=A0A0L8AJF4_9BACT|nr:YetF domain-containing protein [Roseivirga seohaensis]KOF02305.1 membrane protein [Roseivirga seohaensis subsp. aquiponti]